MKRSRHPQAYDYYINNMKELEKIGEEAEKVERHAFQLQKLENIAMYEDGIFEMAHYTTKNSGLPYGIWFDEIGEYRKNKQLVPRVKVLLRNGNLIPVSIEEHPNIPLKGTRLQKAEKELTGKDRELIYDFISKNHLVILKHWQGEIETSILFDELRNNKH